MSKATGVSMCGQMIYTRKKKQKKKGRVLCPSCTHYVNYKCNLMGFKPQERVTKCANFKRIFF